VLNGDGGDVLQHVGVEGGVKWQPKRKEIELLWHSPGRRKAVVLSHDSDETAVPGGRRRLNRRQGEVKSVARSSIEGDLHAEVKSGEGGSSGSFYGRRGERMGEGSLV
jgi:hypothetical protein